MAHAWRYAFLAYAIVIVSIMHAMDEKKSMGEWQVVKTVDIGPFQSYHGYHFATGPGGDDLRLYVHFKGWCGEKQQLLDLFRGEEPRGFICELSATETDLRAKERWYTRDGQWRVSVDPVSYCTQSKTISCQYREVLQSKEGKCENKSSYVPLVSSASSPFFSPMVYKAVAALWKKIK